MNTTPYALSASERNQLSDLISASIEWAAHDNAKNEHVPQFVQERRIFIHPEIRELGHYDCGQNHSGTGGLEEEGYAFLCEIAQFDVDPLDDGTSAMDCDGVGPDPAGTIFDTALETAEESLRKLEIADN